MKRFKKIIGNNEKIALEGLKKIIENNKKEKKKVITKVITVFIN